MVDKTSSVIKEDEQQLIQLIVFRAGHEEFCVPIDAVQEIIKVSHVTPIPNAPDFMRGLINVRGDIVAIINVNVRFNLMDNIIEECKHIIITKQASGLFGLMVNEVLEVLRVKKNDINETPSSMIKIHEQYVKGVVIYEDRMIVLLDLSNVLSPTELVKLSEVAYQYKKKTDSVNELEVNEILPKKKRKEL